MLKQTEQKSKELFDSKELATKVDVRESELRLQKEIETVRSEISNTKIQTLVWIGDAI